jgi:hypothetical protein
MLVRGWARAAAFYTQHLAQQVETLLPRMSRDIIDQYN